MSLFFYKNKFVLQFFIWMFPLAFLPNVCLAELNDLINYIKQHFSTEEEYLTKHKYPGFKTHKSEHDKFIAKVCEYQKNYLIYKTLPIVNLFNFVWDWFAQHILVTDKEYKLYFEEKE